MDSDHIVYLKESIKLLLKNTEGNDDPPIEDQISNK